ncbi:MAG: T9SS type A sorting domain-containing protein [Bacteroidota bacterium]
MKKQLLLSLAMGFTLGITAQNSRTVSGTVVQKVHPSLANKSETANPLHADKDAPTFQTYVNSLNQNHQNTGNRAVTGVTIGTSIYDLQTNASICNRIVVNADGTIGATWTMDHGSVPTSTPTRGTGYNYFDGANWTFGTTGPATRLESDRTGWPNLGVTGTGAEITVSHEASTGAGDLYVMKRPAKGTGTWTETKMGITDTWPRLVVGGANNNTIHVISQTSGAAPTKPPFMGQDGALAYSRSLDGGATWDKLHTVIPEISSTYYLGFGGDNYAIDAKGDNIAIVVGGRDVDVVLLTSTDNGTSWTKKIVHKFPIPMFDAATMVTDTLPQDGNIDTLETNDGSLAVLLDNAGKAHVWYGRSSVFCANPGTATGQGLRFFTFIDGLMYWNENMGSAAPVMITSAADIDGDGILSVSFIGTYYVSLTGMPSAGIDAQGRIFISYAGIYEGISDDGTVGGGKSYRHTYVMRSDDGGATWCTPIDINDPGPNFDDYQEGVFGAVARRVTNDVHLVYQKDSAPGHGLTADTPDPQSGAEADIIYVKIPVTDFVCPVGIKEQTEIASNVGLYPNPASENVSLSFTISKPAEVFVSIYNAIGQKTAEFNNELTVAGNHSLNINTATYKPGIYFVNTTIEGQVFTQKLVVE